jgi:hypothetical protein
MEDLMISDGDFPIEPALGYMMWQANGTPYSPHGDWDTTKRSLLIGYDMIPLRGLAETEARMAARGVRCYPTLVERASEEDHSCYASVVRGRFIPDMLGWSVCQKTAERAFENTAFYFGEIRGHPRFKKLPVPFVMEDEETYLCNGYFFFAVSMHIHPDGRRKTTLAKMRVQVEAIFRRYNIVVVPIRFRIPEGAIPSELGAGLEEPVAPSNRLNPNSENE